MTSCSAITPTSRCGATTSRPASSAHCCAAGLPLIRFHDLRHTFATLQLTAGTNPKVVSECWATRRSRSPDRYSHALPTMQTEAMARLDAVLGRSALDARARSRRGGGPVLWVDEEPRAWLETEPEGDRVQPARGGQTRSPIRAWIGPKVAIWYRIPDSRRTVSRLSQVRKRLPRDA